MCFAVLFQGEKSLALNHSGDTTNKTYIDLNNIMIKRHYRYRYVFIKRQFNSSYSNFLIEIRLFICSNAPKVTTNCFNCMG